MRAKDKQTATEIVMCQCFRLGKKSEKPQRAVATTPSQG